MRQTVMMLSMLVIAVAAAGCSDVCDAYCDTTVDTIGSLGCWEEWGTTWEDQGYADEAEYRAHCKDDYAQRYKDARENSDQAAGEVRQECSDKLDEVDAAESCDDVANRTY